MSSVRTVQLAERRAQLVTQAHLDRARVLLAVHNLRMIVSPPPDPSRAARLRPAAMMLVKIALPLLGLRRASRVLKIVSFGLAALRIARNWR